MSIVKRVVSATLFAILLLGCIWGASNIVQRKSSDFKYTPFFEQKEDFDVLFMGNSHMINGVLPMELWNDYGIVSYNFGGHSNRIPTTYWVMENALDYTHPSLIVIDDYLVGSDDKVSEYSDFIHLSLDSFPISKTKIKGVYDLCDDPNEVDESGICYYDCKWEFIWDFGKYHSRWTYISQNDITNDEVSLEKGAESRIAVAKPLEYELVQSEDVLENSNTVGMEYLRKMIERCQEIGIEVLLVHLPYPASEWDQRAANSVYEVADDYGVNYINFVAMDNVVDYATDCYDPNSHLNPSGAKKVTEYLGRYIKEHYSIPDRRRDANYESWFDDYDAYVNFKVGNLNNQNDLDTELMLLSDDDFSTCIFVRENSGVLKSESICNLIRNLTKNTDFPLLSLTQSTGESYCLIVDNGNNSVQEYPGKEPFEQNTSFGKISYSLADGIPNLHIQDKGTYQFYGELSQENNDLAGPDVKIIAIDNSTKEVISVSEWSYTTTETIKRFQ